MAKFWHWDQDAGQWREIADGPEIEDLQPPGDLGERPDGRLTSTDDHEEHDAAYEEPMDLLESFVCTLRGHLVSFAMENREYDMLTETVVERLCPPGPEQCWRWN